MNPRRTSVLNLACVAGLLAASHASALELTPAEAAGKLLYTQGISTAGATVSARVGAQGTLVRGNTVPCVNCHGADGMGRPEGGVRPPNITWRELAKPYGHRHDNGRRHPAFDEAGFARAVAEGLDPAGQRLDPAMPRYTLAHSDIQALAAYLKRIADDRDPGLGEAVLRIGTILPRSGPLAETAALVEKVLRGVFEQANRDGGIHGRRLELVATEASDPGALHQVLAQGNLFALVAPLVPGLETELPRLAEAAGMPVVGPLGPRAAGQDSRQLFHPLPGEAEQGRALAEFAVRSLELENPETLLVHPDGSPGPALATEAQLRKSGWNRIARHAAAADSPWEETVALGLRREVKVVFFFGQERRFAALAQRARAAGWRPHFLAPAGQAGRAENGGSRVFLAYPSLPGDGTDAGRQALAALRRDQALPTRHQAVQVAAYAAAQVLLEGMKLSGRAASRARLVDALENLHGYETGVTQTLSFGPGQRVGIKGAHVVAADPDTGQLRPVGPFLKLE